MKDENKWTTSKILIYLSLLTTALVGVGIFFYGWYQKHFRGNEEGFNFAIVGVAIIVITGLIMQLVVKIIQKGTLKNICQE